ncbi:proline-rich domain-containing protein [Actinomadura sp. NBRC 104425]|uniref:proline-rich domain-containing protein n=1 Tax=Actinomadura sp. NBRC 104425 TaxID=3032204 RepID=UPI00255601A3|nr:proline-rich domain-containing protein [Actinomadura sp. NBRC 104425]
MTGEPIDHQELLTRRYLLFDSAPRLGWVFQDRRASSQPFSEPPPPEKPLPAYLERRVTETERLAHRRLYRTLPFTLTSAALLALLAAGMTVALPGTSVAYGVLLLALSVAAPGATLTASAVRHRAQAREAYELAYRQTAGRYQAEVQQWQARKQAHDAAEHTRTATRPEWNPVPRPSRRLDVFGGTLWSWEALLTTYGTSALAAQPLLVLDLSREQVSAELVALAEQTGMDVDVQLLPSRQESSTLLSGLPPRDLIDAIVESMHGGTPDAARADRSMDDRILTGICDALGDDVTLGRMAAALRTLMGEPETSDALTRDERRRIANELFSVEYRRQAHANLSRIESYIHPLEDLGSKARTGQVGYLTCIALDSQARNVRADLLTDLIVQWVTLRITASHDSTPALVVAGADELARRHLERLSDACERRGVPLTFMFRRLRDTSAELIGGGAVAFMRLGNHEDATRAADYIGREHRFVLSQITKNVGGNESHTTTDTTGGGDSDSHSTSHTTGTSTSWGTSSSSGANYSGGGLLFPDRSTSRGKGSNRGRSTSSSDTEGRTVSTSRNWSAAYAYAEGTNWSDSDSIQRVYEYAVEPGTLQHLPDHALLLVESAPGGGRTLTPVECDPAIITLDRVSTTPLPPSGQGITPSAAPVAQWLTAPTPAAPRPPLPPDPGPPPGYQTGPRQQDAPSNQGRPAPGRHQGPPPLFGGKE